MGRPQGSPNKPGGQKPGRKPGATKLPQYSDAQILDYKVEVLQLLATGEVHTISDAARKLEIDPTRVHSWAERDKDFQQMLRLSREVVADDIEAQLRGHKHFIPLIFLLKGYRPMFRDSYKVDVTNEALEKLLGELRELKEPKVEVITPPEDDNVIEGEFREIIDAESATT